MASEEETEFFGILFVRSETFQVFGGTAAAVIQEDAGERSAARRAPKHRAQGSRPTMYEYGFRPAGRLAPSHGDRDCQKEGRQAKRVQPFHFGTSQWRDSSTDATDSIGMRRVYLKLRPQRISSQVLVG